MTDAPRRVQLSRAKGWRMPPNTVKVSRPGPFGNPFVVGRDGSRDECVRLYAQLMGNGLICLTCKATPAEQQAARAAVIEGRDRLHGQNLACWCPLNAPCHADLLLLIANAPKEAA